MPAESEARELGEAWERTAVVAEDHRTADGDLSYALMALREERLLPGEHHLW